MGDRGETEEKKRRILTEARMSKKKNAGFAENPCEPISAEAAPYIFMEKRGEGGGGGISKAEVRR